MPTRDIIVVGASAGGVEALSSLVAGLPASLPASVFVVLHLPPARFSALPRILSTAGPLPATHGKDGEPFRHGHIYVAPPDRHLQLGEDVLRLTVGPRENGNRPAADALFRTAAYYHGARVIGVVLSGALDDGSAGLVAVKQAGGLALVQDPNEAFCGNMPRAALRHAEVDHCLPVEAMAELLVRLVKEKVPSPPKRPRVAAVLPTEADDSFALSQPGVPSPFSCPACGGVLSEVHDGKDPRFRCHVGHTYGMDSLTIEQRSQLDAALWAALRALEEQSALAQRMVTRARMNKHEKSAVRFEERADTATEQARLIRQALHLPATSMDVAEEEDEQLPVSASTPAARR